MDWFTIFVIWLIAPVVEGVIIVILLADRGRKEKKPRELSGYGTAKAYKTAKVYLESRKGERSDTGDGRDKAVWYGMPASEKQLMGRKPKEAGAEHDLAQWSYSVPKVPDESMLRTISVKPDPAEKEKRAGRLASDIRDNLGTVSLIIGTVLVVLSGMIFATTKWQVLSDSHKVFLVFVASLLFFAVSHIAEKILCIHGTGNAFYILGSIFLFLTVMAAACFNLLGPDFMLDENGRWKVCWIGSMATEIAFLAGLKRFHDRIYTQAALWGMVISICFMVKAVGAGWNGLMGSMAWLGAGMVMGYRYMVSHRFSGEKEKLAVLVREELAGFLPVHFFAFCVVIAFLWLNLLGYFIDPMYGGTAAGGVFACYILDWVLEVIFCGERGLGCGLLCMGLAAVLAVLSLYVSRLPLQGGKRQGAGMEQAGIYSLAGVYSLWGVLTEEEAVRFFFAGLWFMAVWVFILLKRRKAGQTVQEMRLAVLWEICGFGVLAAGILLAGGDRKWIFGYLLLFAFYCFRFIWIRGLKKSAGLLSSCFLAAAIWEQPFICWPKAVSLEAALLPAAILIWLQGLIWGKTKTVKQLQPIGYICCLMVLTADMLRTNLLMDALILEMICLAAFLKAQVAKDVRWVRISGAFILLAALLMTREFWLSISWWAYLLAAGMGLIVFAAVNEKRKHH